MMKEAESHADEDKKRREEIETRNRADQALYGAERFVKESGDKIPIVDKNAIENAMDGLKKAIETNDAAAMSTAMDALMAAQHKAAEALYRSQATPGGAPPGADGGAPGDGGAAGGTKDGDVIDAEVVDDKK
jgi:molecular chaperone DnaK